jgi:hypothetical protein
MRINKTKHKRFLRSKRKSRKLKKAGYSKGGARSRSRSRSRPRPRSRPRSISRSRSRSRGVRLPENLEFINRLFFGDEKPFFVRSARSHSVEGITRGCYSTVFLILLRYVLRSLFRNQTDKNLFLYEEQLWKLINTPLTRALENVFSRSQDDDGIRTVREFLQKRLLGRCDNVIVRGGNLDILYIIVTAQIIGNQFGERFREDLVTIDNAQNLANAENLYERSYDYPIPLILSRQVDDSPDHWFLLYQGYIISADSAVDHSVGLDFTETSPEEIGSFLNSFITENFEDFKKFYLKYFLSEDKFKIKSPEEKRGASCISSHRLRVVDYYNTKLQDYSIYEVWGSSADVQPRVPVVTVLRDTIQCLNILFNKIR